MKLGGLETGQPFKLEALSNRTIFRNGQSFKLGGLSNWTVNVGRPTMDGLNFSGFKTKFLENFTKFNLFMNRIITASRK